MGRSGRRNRSGKKRKNGPKRQRIDQGQPPDRSRDRSEDTSDTSDEESNCPEDEHSHDHVLHNPAAVDVDEDELEEIWSLDSRKPRCPNVGGSDVPGKGIGETTYGLQKKRSRSRRSGQKGANSQPMSRAGPAPVAQQVEATGQVIPAEEVGQMKKSQRLKMSPAGKAERGGKSEQGQYAKPWWTEVVVPSGTVPEVLGYCEEGLDTENWVCGLSYPLSTSDFLMECWEAKVTLWSGPGIESRGNCILQRFLTTCLDAQGVPDLRRVCRSLRGTYRVVLSSKTDVARRRAEFKTTDALAAFHAWTTGQSVVTPATPELIEECLPPLAATLGMNWGALCMVEDAFRLDAELLWSGKSDGPWQFRWVPFACKL